MKSLKTELSHHRLQPVSKMSGASVRNIEKYLSLEVSDSTKFEKSAIKEYAIEEHLYFDGYDTLLDIEMLDYGFKLDLGLVRELDENGELDLSFDAVFHEECKVLLRGGICADFLFASCQDPVAEFRVCGIDEGMLEKLKVYQSLVYESYVLEKKGQTKLAFFSYFTAAEAFISFQMQDYLGGIHEELHYAAEHIALDDQLRIVGKEAFGVSDLSSVALWGELMGGFRKVKNKRNQLAHARDAVIVTQEDLDEAFFCLAIIHAVCEAKAETFKDVRAYFY